jgi:hypothetical protein
MEEQELDLQLNRTTKLVLKGYPEKSVVLEIRRAVNNHRLGHGWMTESQPFLEREHQVEIRDYMSALASPANHCKRLLTASKTGEKTGCAQTVKKGNEITI